MWYTLKKRKPIARSLLSSFMKKLSKKKHLEDLNSSNILLKVDQYFSQKLFRKANSDFSTYRLHFTKDQTNSSKKAKIKAYPS